MVNESYSDVNLLTKEEIDRLEKINFFYPQAVTTHDTCLACNKLTARCSCGEEVVALLPKILTTLKDQKEELEQVESEELLVLKNYDKYLTAYENIATALGKDTNITIENLISEINSVRNQAKKSSDIHLITSAILDVSQQLKIFREDTTKKKKRWKVAIRSEDLITITFFVIMAIMFFYLGFPAAGWIMTGLIPTYLVIKTLANHEHKQAKYYD